MTTFVTNNGQYVESHLPPISDMVQVIRAYIHQVKGIVINITIDFESQRELFLLEQAYNISINKIRFR